MKFSPPTPSKLRIVHFVALSLLGILINLHSVRAEPVTSDVHINQVKLFTQTDPFQRKALEEIPDVQLRNMLIHSVWPIASNILQAAFNFNGTYPRLIREVISTHLNDINGRASQITLDQSSSEWNTYLGHLNNALSLSTIAQGQGSRLSQFHRHILDRIINKALSTTDGLTQRERTAIAANHRWRMLALASGLGPGQPISPPIPTKEQFASLKAAEVFHQLQEYFNARTIPVPIDGLDFFSKGNPALQLFFESLKHTREVEKVAFTTDENISLGADAVKRGIMPKDVVTPLLDSIPDGLESAPTNLVGQVVYASGFLIRDSNDLIQNDIIYQFKEIFEHTENIIEDGRILDNEGSGLVGFFIHLLRRMYLLSDCSTNDVYVEQIRTRYLAMGGELTPCVSILRPLFGTEFFRLIFTYWLKYGFLHNGFIQGDVYQFFEDNFKLRQQALQNSPQLGIIQNQWMTFLNSRRDDLRSILTNSVQLTVIAGRPQVGFSPIVRQLAPIGSSDVDLFSANICFPVTVSVNPDATRISRHLDELVQVNNGRACDIEFNIQNAQYMPCLLRYENSAPILVQLLNKIREEHAKLNHSRTENLCVALTASIPLQSKNELSRICVNPDEGNASEDQSVEEVEEIKACWDRKLKSNSSVINLKFSVSPNFKDIYSGSLLFKDTGGPIHSRYVEYENGISGLLSQAHGNQRGQLEGIFAGAQTDILNNLSINVTFDRVSAQLPIEQGFFYVQKFENDNSLLDVPVYFGTQSVRRLAGKSFQYTDQSSLALIVPETTTTWLGSEMATPIVSTGNIRIQQRKNTMPASIVSVLQTPHQKWTGQDLSALARYSSTSHLSNLKLRQLFSTLSLAELLAIRDNISVFETNIVLSNAIAEYVPLGFDTAQHVPVDTEGKPRVDSNMLSQFTQPYGRLINQYLEPVIEEKMRASFDDRVVGLEHQIVARRNRLDRIASYVGTISAQRNVGKERWRRNVILGSESGVESLLDWMAGVPAFDAISRKMCEVTACAISPEQIFALALLDQLLKHSDLDISSAENFETSLEQEISRNAPPMSQKPVFDLVVEFISAALAAQQEIQSELTSATASRDDLHSQRAALTSRR